MTKVDVRRRREYIVLIELLYLIEQDFAEIDAVSRLSNESFAEDWDNPEDAVYDTL